MTNTYVIQVREASYDDWEDYICHDSENAIREIFRTLKTAETKLDKSEVKARYLRLINRKMIEEIITLY